MNELYPIFKTYFNANLGDNKARWKLIRKYEPYIDEACRGNNDMKHTIILTLFDLFDNLHEDFLNFFNAMYK